MGRSMGSSPVNINAARTGASSVCVLHLQPRFSALDFAAADLIDAPGYVPTGAHERGPGVFVTDTEFVLGEMLRPGVLS